jgi:hypothetical protein
MKNFVLEIDDTSAITYANFSQEVKRDVNKEIAEMVKKILLEARLARLRKLVDDINNDRSGIVLNPDILLDFLRVEEDD